MDEGGDTSSARWAVALALGAATFVLSYTAQRLYAAWTEGGAAPVYLAEEHIPYYWRCALGWAQAVVVVPIVGMGLGGRAAGLLLRTLPIWLSGVVLLGAAAMVGVP